jgi:hypothetical protein
VIDHSTRIKSSALLVGAQSEFDHIRCRTARRERCLSKPTGCRLPYPYNALNRAGRTRRREKVASLVISFSSQCLRVSIFTVPRWRSRPVQIHRSRIGPSVCLSFRTDRCWFKSTSQTHKTFSTACHESHVNGVTAVSRFDGGCQALCSSPIEHRSKAKFVPSGSWQWRMTKAGAERAF